MLAVHRVGSASRYCICWVDRACIEYDTWILTCVQCGQRPVQSVIYQRWSPTQLHLAACSTHCIYLSDTHAQALTAPARCTSDIRDTTPGPPNGNKLEYGKVEWKCTPHEHESKTADSMASTASVA